jgi:tetratricopeptide (TPR) repeat protein
MKWPGPSSITAGIASFSRLRKCQYFDDPEKLTMLRVRGRLIRRYHFHIRERKDLMKRTWITVVCLALALTLGGAGMVGAQKAEKAIDVTKALSDSYDLIVQGKYAQAEKLLQQVLAREPNNPLALNNLAAALVGLNKSDKALTYLEQALLSAKGYMVQANRVCTVKNICIAFKPLAGGSGKQDLEPLVRTNIALLGGGC